MVGKPAHNTITPDRACGVRIAFIAPGLPAVGVAEIHRDRFSCSVWRFLRSRSTSAERCTRPQPKIAVSEAISKAQRLWFRGGIYVANGDFNGTLGVSTFLSSCLAFFTAFFSFFACFRSPFVILDIRCGPPLAVLAARTLRRVSQAEKGAACAAGRFWRTFRFRRGEKQSS